VKKKVYWIVGVLFALSIVGVPVILSFGNPQWGKHFYMWQAYVIEDNNDRKQRLHYTWWQNGTVQQIYYYGPSEHEYTLVFHDWNGIDVRKEYAKEIAAFEAELAKFEKEHGLK